MTRSLPEIPVHDFRDGGIEGFALARIEGARTVLDTVIGGMGPAGRVVRAALPASDRVSRRWLVRAGDPYLGEVETIGRALGRPGALTFALSYEFGCTTRAFDGPAPTLFRTLDWTYRGLGRLVEVVRLRGPAGDWITATWPGVVGAIHGAAPGRFAACLNQAPERLTGAGRAVDWAWSKVRFLGERGIPPPHLLRRTFETAPDFATARRMLTETPVAAPTIFTLAGTRPGETVTIERTETEARVAEHPAASNGFTTPHPGRWRPRGEDSPGRLAQVRALGAAPADHALAPPILNTLTRLALSADAAGTFSVTGFEGPEQVTATRHLAANSG